MASDPKQLKDWINNMSKNNNLVANTHSSGIGVKELQTIFIYKPETILNKLKSLFERGLIEKVSGKPVKYTISKSYLES